jgi:hypothetical protein
MVSQWILVEKTRWECIERPWMKGGILASGGDVRVR